MTGGTCVKSYFENRLFWAVSAKVDENVGQPRDYHLSTYGYLLAEQIANGTLNARLEPQYRIRITDHISKFDGRPFTLHTIVLAERETEMTQ